MDLGGAHLGRGDAVGRAASLGPSGKCASVPVERYGKNFTDGKWHKIKVKVTPPRGLPHLFVRTKDGYYATTNPR